MTLQNLALLAPVVMVVAVAIFVLVEEWFNQRAMVREQTAAAATSPAPRATDINETTIRRISEMLREIEPKKASRKRRP
jgi:hypothetical protein